MPPGWKGADDSQSGPKLDQMISLAVSSTAGRPIKKMLHMPTLKVYCVKEVPINSRDVRNMLKQLLQDWGKASSEDGSRTFLTRLKGVHWNTPEGCVSIVSENLNGGSLLNMLQSTGAIPELILKQIARKVLELSLIHI